MRYTPWTSFYLISIVLFWSINFILIKAALTYISPYSLTFLRFLGATIVFVIIALIIKKPLIPNEGERLSLAIIGLLQIGIVSTFSAVGIDLIAPGRAAVVIYTMQIWAIPIALWMNKEQLSRQAIIGIIIAVAGITIFLNPWSVDWSHSPTLTGYLILLCVAFSWALGATWYRKYDWQTHSITQMIWQLLFSTLLSAFFTFSIDGQKNIQWATSVWIVLIYNWLIASALCFWLWNHILRYLPASQAGQFVSLVPTIVLFISALLFDEPITLPVISGALLIAFGITITFNARQAFIDCIKSSYQYTTYPTNKKCP